MPHAAYPTAADLEARLTGMNLEVGDIDLDQAAATGRASIETPTGRVFLAEDGTRTFDPPEAPSRVLDLREDLAGSPTALTFASTAYTLGTDYRLLDQNAAARGKPYWAVQFLRFFAAPIPTSYWGCISITGPWGYAEQIPDDVWEAMMAAALLSIAPDLTLKDSDGLTKWSEAGVTEEYGGELYGKSIDRLQKRVDTVVTNYRRVQVGIGE